MTRGIRRAAAVLLPAAFLVLSAAPAASAHPLGNFTVNTYSGIVVTPDGVRVDVVVDHAEIPAIRVRQDADTDRDGQPSEAEAAAYASSRCAALPALVSLRVDGAPVPLTAGAGGLTFPPGAAGLATARLTCVLTGTADTVGRTLTYESRAFTERVGWREVVAAGDGVALAGSTAPAASPSAVLTAYPEDLLSSPLDQRTATLEVVRGAGTGAGVLPAGVRRAPGVDRLTQAFQGLAARDSLGPGFVLLALLACVGLGAAHAFAPGHGKTVMAAYLVGRGGNLRHAAALGLSVTLTHTIGVLVLGVALSSAALVAPERLYPVLGLASGLLVVVIGAVLLTRATGLRGRLAHAWSHRRGAAHQHAPHGHEHHDHEHGHDHEHAHQPGEHSHGGRTHRHDVPAQPGIRGVLALGLAGGLVPSPSALVVLLGAIALQRAWFGVLLVVAYGIGMALALVGVGLLLVRTRGSVQRWAARRSGRTGRGALRVASALPVVTAVVVVTVGLGLTMQAAGQV